ncbi:hypothetical protein NDN08_003853 [Rhodosorus marinus]|uniref:YqaJ viral recombinase domain-containing protein n=1 Tax=Rhodosorus marinus TaxID=101924 RepID=A0AAV8ULY3_9RHOD|nr:hypothetical protein NDN08_003853 [Rhodosorus marinus]
MDVLGFLQFGLANTRAGGQRGVSRKCNISPWNRDQVDAEGESTSHFYLWNGLLKNLDYERVSGYGNYVGTKGNFSEFSASLLASASGPSEFSPNYKGTKRYKAMAKRLLFEFSKVYESASVDERRKIIRDASFLAEEARFKSLRELRSAKNNQPNLSWLEVDPAVLENHPRYKALEPDGLENIDEEDPRLFRQRSEKWFAAREGCAFTASTIWRALGFGEVTAAKKLGAKKIPKFCVDHGLALETYALAKSTEPPVKKLSEVDQVRIEWGLRHEDRAKLLLLEANDAVYLEETGMYELNSENAEKELGVELKNLPMLSASPDSILRFYNTDMGAWSDPHVCEIKCRCPFIWSGKAWLMPSRIGSHKEVNAMHYAQVQIQMLCCEMETAQLASYSVRGSQIFQLKRNDEWLRLALRFLCLGNERYVLGDLMPEINFFYDDTDYQRFLELTVEGCKSAVPWLQLPPEDIFARSPTRQRPYY